MENTTIFVVSDDTAFRDSASDLFASADLNVETFASLDLWLSAVPPERRGCLLLDAQARELTGAERLALFSGICAQRPVLLLIDRGDVPSAVLALRRGAADVVEKPYRDEDLLERIERTVATRRNMVCEPRAS